MIQKPLVWDALIAWRDEILKKDVLRKSKTVSLSNMSKLIEKGIFDLEDSLSEFIKVGQESKLQKINQITEWPKSTKQSRHTLFKSFYKFAKTKNIKKADVVIPFEKYRSLKNVSTSELLISEILAESLSSNEDKAKSRSLTGLQLEKFFEKLRKINERDFLICWTLWNLRCTIHQVLNLKVSDYNHSTEVFKVGENDYRLGKIREDLKELIQKQCENKRETDLIFSTNTGNCIHPGQIVRTMKIASKQAKLPIIISPKLLYAHAIIYGKNEFEAMSKEEVEMHSKLNDKRYETIIEKTKNVFAQ